MTYPLSFMTKRGSSFENGSSHVLRGRVSIGDIFVRRSVYTLRDVVRTFCIFSFLYFLETLFLQCDRKPCTHFDICIYIYILRLLLHSFTYLFMCCFFSLFMHMLLINCMQSFIFLFHMKIP